MAEVTSSTPDFANMPGLSFGGFGGAPISGAWTGQASPTGYVSPYSQDQITKYTDMFLSGKDYSGDAAYNAFLNDADFQNAITENMAGQVFDLGLTAQDMAADFDYNKPTEHGLLGWQEYRQPNMPSRDAKDTNYWNYSANKVINAPQSLIDEAKAANGAVVGPGTAGLGEYTGFVWKDGALREAQYVHNTGSPTSSVLPLVLAMMAPGIGTAVGTSLGLGATMAPIVGGALVGGGTAALTGGDIIKGAVMGGMGGAGGTQIGDTGVNLGQVTAGINVAKNLESGNLLGAVTGAANLSGANNTQVGDTGFTLGDLAKNANLAQSIASGNPQALFAALTSVSKYAGGPSSSDMIEGYFAPGGEGYIAPTGAASDTYTPTTDYGIGADYSLFGGSTAAPSLEDMGGGQGLQVAPVDETQNVGFEPIDYGLDTTTPFDELQMPTTPNVDSMGGGQGLTVPVAGGTLTETGLIPTGTASNLGDPDSFINKPAPGADVSAAVKAASDAADKASAQQKAAASAKAASDKAAADKVAAAKQVSGRTAAATALDALLAQQAQQNALMQMMSGNPELANIKSNTNLFGAIPGMEPPASSAQQQDTPDTSWDQQFATGGHVDDFSVDALLHILRS